MINKYQQPDTSRHYGGRIKEPLKPLGTSYIWYREEFNSRPITLSPIMPRDQRESLTCSKQQDKNGKEEAEGNPAGCTGKI